MPVLTDVDGDGKTEVTLQGGYSPGRTYKHDLSSPLWTSTDTDKPLAYGGVANCGGGVGGVLVEASLAYSARLKVTRMSGANAGQFSTLWLSAGKSYADQATAKAGGGGFLGQLTAVSIHQNLAGDGTPTAVVGSSDGWLYGVNPCTATLRFARDFGAPVGEAVFGDVRGTGLDDILVTAGDGYLYGLRNFALPSPTNVVDLDPDHGSASADVDVTQATTSLTGKWSAVAGATRYEVAAVDASGAYLTTPAWTDVGAATDYTIRNLSLVSGARYVFTVRAVMGSVLGADSPSDGVVVAPATGDAGPDAGDSAVGDAGADAGADATVNDGGADARPNSGDEIAGSSCVCRAGEAGREGRNSLAGLGLVALAGLLVGRRVRRT
jgi:MYXO-CTERM domain-containing protein